jgi:hypothetical protein
MNDDSSLGVEPNEARFIVPRDKNLFYYFVGVVVHVNEEPYQVVSIDKTTREIVVRRLA